MVVERLLAEPIARDEEPLAARVPDGEGEHPRQPLGKRVAPLFITVDEHLGVAARAEDVPARDQFVAQAEIIVNLSVEGDGDRAVLVVHGLRAVRREIDDRKPPVPERDRSLHEQAAAVRPAVRDDVGHAPQQFLVRGPLPVAVQEAADAAHGAASWRTGASGRDAGGVHP